MIRFLMTVLLVVFGLSTANAKVKNNYSAVKFNWDAFQKLSESDQLSYIKGYIQFFEEVEAANNKSGKKAYLWETFLVIDEAYAADYFCFNGGIAYRTANQAACGTGAPPASAAPELFSCGANQARCSLVFGVGSNNKGFCYSTENNGRRTATRQCREAAEAGGGPARIAQAVRRCGQANPPANCAPLKKALDGDTAQLASYCTEGHHKAMCQGMVARNNVINGRRAGTVAAVTAPAAAPATAPAPQGEGCADVNQKVISDAISNGNPDRQMDPKWLRMLSIAQAACPENRNLGLDTMIKNYGTCMADRNSPSTEADERTSGQLNDSINAVRNSTVNNEASKNFQYYFGISPTEFKGVFCNPTARTAQIPGVNGAPATTLNIEGGKTIQDRLNNFIRDENNNSTRNRGVDQSVGRDMLDAMLSSQNAEALVGRVSDADLKTSLQAHLRDHRESVNLHQRVREFQSMCDSNSPNTSACQRYREAKAQIDNISGAAQRDREARVALSNRFAAVGPNVAPTIAAARMRRLLGDDLYTEMDAQLAQRRQGPGGSLLGNEAQLQLKRREGFVRCVREAKDRNSSVECRSNPDALANNAALNPGSYVVVDRNTRRCFHSDGTLTPSSSCVSGSLSLRALHTGAATQPITSVCLNETNRKNYTIQSFSCGTPGSVGMPPVQDMGTDQ